MPQKRYQKTKITLLIKANHVLRIVFLALVLIGVRIWHLTIIQHEESLEESRKPQRRVVIEPSKRGTIRDRFNIPLAINKVQYNAGIIYAEIRQIPSISWENKKGKRIKRYKRREYITRLAQILGEELHLDPERVENLIHSKASFHNNLPFIIKEDIPESVYYRLKMLEKDWVGIHMQRLPKRYYPRGKVAADIIGYMGAISQGEYESVVREIKTLETCIKNQAEESLLKEGLHSVEEAKQRLKMLMEHAYSIHDSVGKTGIEARYEQNLRGYRGEKRYFSDARGNFLRELPGSREPLSGQRLLLTISAELQEYAETLLIQNEKIRSQKTNDGTDETAIFPETPWVKGGAIVAMDPNNGEILALASYPRFDPNDFIATGNPAINKEKNAAIRHWFEIEGYIGEIWDMVRPLERERFDEKKGTIVEEACQLTWEKYLNFLLPQESAVREGLKHIETIKQAVKLQRNMRRLLTLAGTDETELLPLLNTLYGGDECAAYEEAFPELKEHAASVAAIKEECRYFSKISDPMDRLLLIDLCRLVVREDYFSKDLLDAIGEQSLSTYRAASAAMVAIEETVRQLCKELFRLYHFKPWCQENQQEFLKEKRAEEKTAGKRYAKPYLDLLDEQENEMFTVFWGKHRWQMLLAFLVGKSDDSLSELLPYYRDLKTWEREVVQGAHQALSWNQAYWTLRDILQEFPFSLAYLQSLRSFKDLDRPLLGRYRHIRRERGKQLEKHLAAAFYPVYGYGYGRSFAYRQAALQGSIFKLVTAYEALVQRYQKFGESDGITVEQLNPFEMIDDIHKRGRTTYLGYDDSGKPIPQRYKGGRLPKSHRSMGKVDLLKAFEVSSNPYFSLLAANHLEHPDDLAKAARKFSFGRRTGVDLPAEISGCVPEDLEYNRNGLYALAIGQHTLVVTPLQTAVMLAALANGGDILKPKIVKLLAGKTSGETRDLQHTICVIPTEVKDTVFMPKIVQRILLEGMHRALSRAQTAGIMSLSRMYRNHPEAISDYLEVQDCLIGKSSTAQSMESMGIDARSGPRLVDHIWFGGILYETIPMPHSDGVLFSDQFGKPELVVVVYLRHGAWGKDAGPVAAQVAQKWREIKSVRKIL